MRNLFWLGILMLFYDFSGHFVVGVARLLAKNGYNWLGFWWNANSTLIWQSIPDPQKYDVFWSVWHGVTMILLIVGYWSGSSATQKI